MSILSPSKNDVAIKITIKFVIDYYWILIKLLFNQNPMIINHKLNSDFNSHINLR
jgi:hypothetical protein